MNSQERSQIILQMRQEGSTLQEIGDTLGISKERVRQLIKKHGGINRGGLTRQELADYLCCSAQRLTKLEEAGVLHPRHDRYLFIIYNEEEALKAEQATQEYCAHCNRPLPPKHHGKYCQECHEEHQRNPYAFASEADKARRNRTVKAWKSRSQGLTEEEKLIARQEHFNTTSYIVIRGGIPPIGTVFKAIEYRDGYLILADGMEIPTFRVRRLEDDNNR